MRRGGAAHVQSIGELVPLVAPLILSSDTVASLTATVFVAETQDSEIRRLVSEIYRIEVSVLSLI